METLPKDIKDTLNKPKEISSFKLRSEKINDSKIIKVYLISTDTNKEVLLYTYKIFGGYFLSSSKSRLRDTYKKATQIEWNIEGLHKFLDMPLNELNKHFKDDYPDFRYYTGPDKPKNDYVIETITNLYKSKYE